MRSFPWLALAGLCLVAGCGPKAPANAVGGGNALGGSASGGDKIIAAADLPVPRAGDWAETVTQAGKPPQTQHHCEAGKPIDAAALTRNCSQFTTKHTPQGDWVIDSVCERLGYVITLHAVAHGDFQTTYSADSQMNQTKDGGPTVNTIRHTEAHYVGPCPTRPIGG